MRSGMRCACGVRCWDQNGKSTSWSEPANWEMGLLHKDDWKGEWIGATTDTNYHPAPFLRRSVYLGKPISSARMYISGLGYYELRCNGKRVGDHLLDPGYTRYDRRALYVTYDMTPNLRQGENAIGIILGTGWQNVHTRAVWYFDRAPWRAAPRVLADLRVVYTDGTVTDFATGTDWKCATGPIVFDSIYGGETYDARLEKPGWDTTGFDDAAWKPSIVVPAPGGLLAAQAMPPIRATRVLSGGHETGTTFYTPYSSVTGVAATLTEPKPGVWLFDFGQGLAGHARLTVSAPAGTRIKMRYGERLHPDGTLDASHLESTRLRPTRRSSSRPIPMSARVTASRRGRPGSSTTDSSTSRSPVFPVGPRSIASMRCSSTRMFMRPERLPAPIRSLTGYGGTRAGPT